MSSTSPRNGRGSNQYSSKGTPTKKRGSRTSTAGTAAAVTANGQPHWQSVNPSVDNEAVCRRCNDGWHHLCIGHGTGSQFESPTEAKKRYPTCLCADQGHPADLTCRESAGGVGRGARSHPCGNPIKAHIEMPEMGLRHGPLVERGVCGTHLNAYTKKVNDEEMWSRQREERRVAHQRGEELGRAAADVIEMLAELNITGEPHADRSNNPTGDVVVNGEQLAAMLRRYKLFQEVFGDELPGDL